MPSFTTTLRLQAGDIASDEHVATARWVGQGMTGNALSALAVGLSKNSKVGGAGPALRVEHTASSQPPHIMPALMQT